MITNIFLTTQNSKRDSDFRTDLVSYTSKLSEGVLKFYIDLFQEFPRLC